MRKLFCVLCFIVFVHQANGQTNAKELLAKYRESLLPLQKISSKIKTVKHIKSHANPKASERVQVEEFIFRTDGKKCEWLGKWWTTDIHNKKLGEDRPIYDLYDGNSFVQLAQDNPYPERNFYHATMYTSGFDEEKEIRLEHPNYAGPMNGRMYGNKGKSVADLLLDSRELKVNESLESINGIDCYVIEGSSRYGKVTAWIAPSKGYNAVKWSIEKNKDKGDFFDDKKLYNEKWTAIFEADSFQQIDDIFITASGELKFETISDSGQVSLSEYKYERTEVDLNPDFVALNAFQLNLPEETRVVTTDSPRVIYIWRNDKLETYVSDKNQGQKN